MMVSLPIIRRLLAPIIVSLFAIGWYLYSVDYILPNNSVALSHGVFSAYVPTNQIDGYIQATTYICYAIVYIALAIFWYNLVKTVRELEVKKSV